VQLKAHKYQLNTEKRVKERHRPGFRESVDGQKDPYRCCSGKDYESCEEDHLQRHLDECDRSCQIPP